MSNKALEPTKKEIENAALSLDSRLLSAATVKQFCSVRVAELDINGLYSAVTEKNRDVRGGDLGHVETMLFSQATALDSVFHELLRRSAQNMGEYPEAFERYMKLGLKAQAQCRTTLEALAEIKQPKSLTITKQANIAGQQVVNNGTMNTNGGGDPARGENQKPQNELLGAVEHDSLDAGETTTTITANQTVEAVGAVNRG